MGCGQRVFGRCLSGGNGCFSGGSDRWRDVGCGSLHVHEIGLFVARYYEYYNVLVEILQKKTKQGSSESNLGTEVTKNI